MKTNQKTSELNNGRCRSYRLGLDLKSTQLRLVECSIEETNLSNQYTHRHHQFEEGKILTIELKRFRSKD